MTDPAAISALASVWADTDHPTVDMMDGWWKSTQRAAIAAALLTPERLAEALHKTGLNTIGRKQGSHGTFTSECICNSDAETILAALRDAGKEPDHD